MTSPGAATPLKSVPLIVGLLVCAASVIWFRPDSLDRSGQLVAGVGLLMAIWWATEAIPLAVTALLPLVLFPIMGVNSISDSSAPYANPIVFLFLGGFLVALAVERCGLHRRIALSIFIALGRSAAGLIAGFMLVAALLSMWISNTSTVLMLFPIAASLTRVVSDTSVELSDREQRDFQVALLLGLAYGASIGGIATLVGTPTNALMVGFMQAEYAREIPFARWMLVGMPLTMVLLPLVWFMLTRVLNPVRFGASDAVREKLKQQYLRLGPMSVAEQRTAMLFALLVFCWVSRGWIVELTGLSGLSDTGIAMAAATLAFLIPSGSDRHALVTWEDTRNLPWGVLILFGGGLSLASALSSSGLTLWLGQQLAPLGHINTFVLLVVLSALVVFLTELTSNVATTATLLPVLAALAIQLHLDPLLFVVPVTMAASCAFMLPVATPPNAIVFSSGELRIADMLHAGLWLNVMSIGLISIITWFWVPLVF